MVVLLRNEEVEICAKLLANVDLKHEIKEPFTSNVAERYRVAVEVNGFSVIP